MSRTPSLDRIQLVGGQAPTCSISARLTSRASSVYLPLWIFDMSRMSLMTRQQMRGGVADQAGVLDDLRVLEAPRVVLAEQLGKADHRIERRAQLDGSCWR